jgi:hypothetical protein
LVPVPSDPLIAWPLAKALDQKSWEKGKCTGSFVKDATAKGYMSGLVSALPRMIAHIAMERVISGKCVCDVADMG